MTKNRQSPGASSPEVTPGEAPSREADPEQTGAEKAPDAGAKTELQVGESLPFFVGGGVCLVGSYAARAAVVGRAGSPTFLLVCVGLVFLIAGTLMLWAKDAVSPAPESPGSGEIVVKKVEWDRLHAELARLRARSPAPAVLAATEGADDLDRINQELDALSAESGEKGDWEEANPAAVQPSTSQESWSEDNLPKVAAPPPDDPAPGVSSELPTPAEGAPKEVAQEQGSTGGPGSSKKGARSKKAKRGPRSPPDQ